MSGFAGAAWLRGDAPDALPDAIRDAFCTQLPASVAPMRWTRTGPSWLWSARANRYATEAHDSLRTYEGYIGQSDLAQSDFGEPHDAASMPLARWSGHDRDLPEGHFALASFDARSRAWTFIRSASGGERLYLAEHQGWLLFATSVRALLAIVGAELHHAAALQCLHIGRTLGGTQTVFRPIHEVPAGHAIVVDRHGARTLRCTVDRSLAPPIGDEAGLAARFKDALTRAVAASIGNQRPVAIALSGGIDSSAVLAALTDVVPCEDIVAYSYEFHDPGHTTETHYAQSVARSLGVTKHRTFQLRYDDYIRDIPEHVFRSECPVHWPKAFLVAVARHLAARGHDRYLTGFGIGSHMAYLHEVAPHLPTLVRAGALRLWQQHRFSAWDRLMSLERLHPSLPPPHPRLYYPLLAGLEALGLLRDHRAYFPSEVHPLLPALDHDALHKVMGSGPLADQLVRLCFAHLISCVDVTRSERSSRELGCKRVSPAHFASVIPFAYFPIRPAPRLGTEDRLRRPGKLLLQRAYRGRIPDEVLFRVKSWDDAVASHTWRRHGRIAMLETLDRFPHDLGQRLGADVAKAVLWWEALGIQASGLSFRLFDRMFSERSPSPVPPRWQDLATHVPRSSPTESCP